MSKWKCKKIDLVGGQITAEMLEQTAKQAYNSFGSTKTIYEVHPDGVKEVTCDFCDEPCGTDWCPTKDEE